MLSADPDSASLRRACANRCDRSETPGLCAGMAGDDTSEPPARGDDGPSERVMRNGVLHALCTDSGVPEMERRVGVEPREIDGKCSGPSPECTGKARPLCDDDNELESENCEPGLDEPASIGSGLRRGETCTLPEKGEW